MMKNSASVPAEGFLTRFQQGTETHVQDFLGSHPIQRDGEDGYVFRVWAPHAVSVSLIGDFNGWDDHSMPMEVGEGGIWECFVPGLDRYATYKYVVRGRSGETRAKSDPFAFHAETRPGNASKTYDLSGYEWGDNKWMERRAAKSSYDQPVNIYEMHLGSWRRTGDDRFLSYRDIADRLVPYLKEMHYTHVEFLPVMEHPLDASWGYQCTGYFAATSRYGIPHDLMYLVDQLHQAGIGVILDWVPSHFPRDGFGLYHFDGEPLYEYVDPRKGEHREWGTMVFDYGKGEVRSFLISSALFWLEQFHADGLRVDAVASMLYLDYNRQSGEWIPNVFGGHENLEAVDFLQKMNTAIFAAQPNTMMIAEESTAWPRVTQPVGEGGLEGGLGFNFKWNMGWMNDMQHYMKLDPYFRQYNHKDITFSFFYAFSENYVLPFSHDEVVHMKGSLMNKMPGETPQKFAGVRAFYTYMLTHPGKKLMIMGSEFGQWNEWHYEHSLDWHLLNEEEEWSLPYRQTKAFFQAANEVYLKYPQLWEVDYNWEGFQWVCPDDAGGNTVVFLRKDKKGEFLIIACNFSPVHREGYRIGVPVGGKYGVILNSDEETFGGTGAGNKEPIASEKVPCHDQDQSIVIDLPAMSGVVLRCVRKNPVRKPKEDKPDEKKAAPKARRTKKAKEEA